MAAGVDEKKAEAFVDVVTRADEQVATERHLERTKWQIIVVTTTAVAAFLAVFKFPV